MATGYFTRLCVFFSSLLSKPFLLLSYRSSPDIFFQVLTLRLCGHYVFVSKFPSYLGFTDEPGWYFVDSVIFDYTGLLQIGLRMSNVEYYDLSSIQITDIKFS